MQQTVKSTKIFHCNFSPNPWQTHSGRFIVWHYPPSPHHSFTWLLASCGPKGTEKLLPCPSPGLPPACPGPGTPSQPPRSVSSCPGVVRAQLPPALPWLAPLSCGRDALHTLPKPQGDRGVSRGFITCGDPSHGLFLTVALHCAQKFCEFHKCHRLCDQGFVPCHFTSHSAKKKPCNKNMSDEGAEPSSESKSSFSNGNCKVISYRSANAGPRQRTE